MIDNGWHDRVLTFWFDELTPEDWFTGKAETDEKIRERFAELHAELSREVPAQARTDVRSALAAIIVFDQFSRNLHRKKPGAFATDAQALGLARAAIESGMDAELPEERRRFLYMPLMHSEVLADQERAVDLFKQLGDGTSAKYAIEHRDIIARFGRFPHRNRVLGRESTPEETAFLEGHDGFGQ